jgi:hypothetical protein
MITQTSPSESIAEAVTSRPGVEAGPRRCGEFAFGVATARSATSTAITRHTFSFPKAVWTELYASGRIVHHPVFPDKEGPAARRIAKDEDVREMIALMRLDYERWTAAGSCPAATARPPQRAQNHGHDQRPTRHATQRRRRA